MNKILYKGYEINYDYITRTTSISIHGIELKKYRKKGNIIGLFMAKCYINTLPLFTKKEPQLIQEHSVCRHSTRDRVLTHRGYHCNNCGKRF